MARAWLINPFKIYADRVKESSRFGQDQKTRDFIELALATAERCKQQIEPGQKFWRAQLGHQDVVSVPDANGEWAYDSIRPHSPDRMTPSSRFVKNGRANPVGIPCWYAATNPKTAVAEMRPWQGAILTVAELTATRNLQFVDFGKSPMVGPYNKSKSQLERYIWNSIGEAFSRPVAPETIDVEYVPTQMLADAFRNHHFDGIQYKSHLDDGMNIVVFDLSHFAIGKCELWASTVSYKPEPHGDEMQKS